MLSWLLSNIIEYILAIAAMGYHLHLSARKWLHEIQIKESLLLCSYSYRGGGVLSKVNQYTELAKLLGAQSLRVAEYSLIYFQR